MCYVNYNKILYVCDIYQKIIKITIALNVTYEIILKKKISLKFLKRKILCCISFLDYFMFHLRSRQKYFKKSDTTLLKSVISRLDGIFHMF